jgi:uncharacterized protein (TIGR02271 family)
MSRTVTALYDTKAEAEAARQRLSSIVDVNSARVIDKDNNSSGGSGGSGNSLNSVHMSHEDRHAYHEGIQRGGFLLCADVGGHEDADKIVRVLEESASVDMDERQQSWRNEGWSPYSGGTAGTGSNLQGSGSTGMTGAASTAGTGTAFQGGGSTGTNGNVVQEEHIPIVEEVIRVGKREVNRGGARVRSYIREVPVHEEVSLREEHVSIERRPVNETLRSADLQSGDLLQERTVEMTETAEEAVVAKEARVREELVVRKTAEEHVEQIDQTVRRTEVDVDEGARGQGDKSAFGGFGNDRPASTQQDLERDRSR